MRLAGRRAQQQSKQSVQTKLTVSLRAAGVSGSLPFCWGVAVAIEACKHTTVATSTFDWSTQLCAHKPCVGNVRGCSTVRALVHGACKALGKAACWLLALGADGTGNGHSYNPQHRMGEEPNGCHVREIWGRGTCLLTRPLPLETRDLHCLTSLPNLPVSACSVLASSQSSNCSSHGSTGRGTYQRL